MRHSGIDPWKAWGPGELANREKALAADGSLLATVQGELLRDVFIPARGFMPAQQITAGDVVRFIDVLGQQVPDIILFDRTNIKNCSSAGNTKLVAKKWAISTGDSIYAKFGQKMATIVEKTVTDDVVVGGFCNAEINQVRYGISGTHSCRGNLVASMAQYGLTPADIEEGVFGPFMRLVHHSDGRMEMDVPRSQAGDYVDFRADIDLIVAASACPAERNPCNGWNPTPIRVIIYRS